jgi:hypothetical protein
VPVELPSTVASSSHRTVTLAELRDLVAVADTLMLPGDLVVRGKAVPFKVSDLGNPRGGCLTSIALDHTA